MAKRTRKQAKFASDAALQAIVRFGPEASGLKELAREAQEERNTSIAQAHGSAAAMTNEIDAARPGVAAIYDQAGLDQAKAAQSVAATDLSGLGAGANAFRAAAGIETGEAARHTAEARAATLSDLSTRRVQARAGEGFAVQEAQRKFASDIAKVLARRQDLGREQGAFTASTINSLEQSDLDRTSREDIASGHDATTRRGQTLTHGDRVATRRQKAAADAAKKAAELPGGVKLNTRAMHGHVSDQISQLQGWIAQNRGDYRSRAEMARDLLNGVPGSTVTKDEKGNPLPNPIRDPGVPKAPSALALSAALDLVFNGQVSNGTARRLHQRGYSVNELGLTPTPKRKPRPRSAAAQQIPGFGSTPR